MQEQSSDTMNPNTDVDDASCNDELDIKNIINIEKLRVVSKELPFPYNDQKYVKKPYYNVDIVFLGTTSII